MLLKQKYILCLFWTLFLAVHLYTFDALLGVSRGSTVYLWLPLNYSVNYCTNTSTDITVSYKKWSLMAQMNNLLSGLEYTDTVFWFWSFPGIYWEKKYITYHHTRFFKVIWFSEITFLTFFFFFCPHGCYCVIFC